MIITRIQSTTSANNINHPAKGLRVLFLFVYRSACVCVCVINYPRVALDGSRSGASIEFCSRAGSKRKKKELVKGPVRSIGT